MYVLVYLGKGELPWQGLKTKNKHEKTSQIMESKMATPEQILCRGLPQEFTDVMIYIKSLDFEEKPNYEMIRGKFKLVFNKLHTNKKEEVLTDWQLLRKQKKEEKEQQKNAQKQAKLQGLVNNEVAHGIKNQVTSIIVILN